MCNRAPECIGLQEVGKTPAPVDLDDRNPLPVLRFERLVAADVHGAQLEAQLILKLAQLCERALAQVAALRVIDDDLRLTGKCHA